MLLVKLEKIESTNQAGTTMMHFGSDEFVIILYSIF